MRVILQPSHPPPHPRGITGLSPDAEIVWEHLQQAAQKYNNVPNSGSGNYYQAMYKKRFGVLPGQQLSSMATHLDTTPTQQHNRLGNNQRPCHLTNTMTTPSPAPRWLNMPASDPEYAYSQAKKLMPEGDDIPAESPLLSLANEYNKNAWNAAADRTPQRQRTLHIDTEYDEVADRKCQQSIYLPNIQHAISNFNESSNSERDFPMEHNEIAIPDHQTHVSDSSNDKQAINNHENNLSNITNRSTRLQSDHSRSGKGIDTNIGRELSMPTNGCDSVNVANDKSGSSETQLSRKTHPDRLYVHQDSETPSKSSDYNLVQSPTTAQRSLFSQPYQLMRVKSQVPEDNIEVIGGSQDLFDYTQQSCDESSQRSRYFYLSGDSPPLELSGDCQLTAGCSQNSVHELKAHREPMGCQGPEMNHTTMNEGGEHGTVNDKSMVTHEIARGTENTRDINGTQMDIVQGGDHVQDKTTAACNKTGVMPNPPSSISKKLREMQKGDRHRDQKEASWSDAELQKIEKLFHEVPSEGPNLPKRPKKSSKTSFQVPAKKSSHHQVQETPQRKVSYDKLHQVEFLSEETRTIMRSQILEAEEVAMTLVYNDGSSQISPPKEQKRKSNTTNASPSGIGLMFSSTEEQAGISKYRYVFVSFVDTLRQWTSGLIEDLMGSKQCKICYDGQELVKSCVMYLNLSHKSVIQSWVVQDPRVAAWLLDPDSTPSCLQDTTKPFTDLKQKHEEEAGLQLCSDLELLMASMKRLRQRLSNNHLWTLFIDLEMRLSPILAIMELRGISVNTKDFIHATELLKRKIRKLETAAHQAAGRQFTLSSHVQLRQVLFDELKLDQRLEGKAKIARTTVKHQKSTSEAVLLQLSDTHPLPDIVLQHRQLLKLKSTYMDGMIGHVTGGMLYTHWDQTAAATGRLTSTSPNIQAIPKQPVTINIASIQPTQCVAENTVNDDEEEEIYARSPFVSREGYTLIAADFQQIELRLLAHLADDKDLIDIFNDRSCQDIFIELTSQWLNKNKESVSSSEREQTKRIVYSVMYGAGKDRLAEYLRVSPEEAKNIMTSFLVKFPAVNSFTKSCIDEARVKGHQRTILKRRRLFPHIRSPNPQLRAYSERQAVNFCVQGSAADLCKAAMIQVEHALQSRDLDARLLVQIHDELLLEVRDQQIKQTAGVVKSIMESADGLCGPNVALKVPLKVSLSHGKSWSHMSNLPDTN